MEKKFGRGDIVWIDFSSTKGHEQRNKRPAVVLSPKNYNEKSCLMIVAPITNKQKGYPFEVNIDSENISGVVLTDQIRTINWQARNVQKAGKVNENTMNKISHHLKLLLPI